MVNLEGMIVSRRGFLGVAASAFAGLYLLDHSQSAEKVAAQDPWVLDPKTGQKFDFKFHVHIDSRFLYSQFVLNELRAGLREGFVNADSYSRNLVQQTNYVLKAMDLPGIEKGLQDFLARPEMVDLALRARIKLQEEKEEQAQGFSIIGKKVKNYERRDFPTKDEIDDIIEKALRLRGTRDFNSGGGTWSTSNGSMYDYFEGIYSRGKTPCINRDSLTIDFTPKNNVKFGLVQTDEKTKEESVVFGNVRFDNYRQVCFPRAFGKKSFRLHVMHLGEPVRRIPLSVDFLGNQKILDLVLKTEDGSLQIEDVEMDRISHVYPQDFSLHYPVNGNVVYHVRGLERLAGVSQEDLSGFWENREKGNCNDLVKYMMMSIKIKEGKLKVGEIK